MNKILARCALLGVASLAIAGCEIGEAAEEPLTYLTAEVTRGDLSVRAEATGIVEPIRQVEVKSKASGEILRLHVDIGDEVRPGSLLAEVDPRDVRNRYDQTEADMEVAQARVEIANAQLDRSEQLLAAEVVTEQEHEARRLEYANAQASLVKAETNFELAELQLEDVTIRAPSAGTIIQKNVEEGQVIQSASQNVSGGTTLFVMADLGELRVRALVDETDIGELRSGMSAIVRVDAFPDQAFEGMVENIEPQAVVQQNVTMFAVIVNLDNRSGLLRPGMNAEVEILIEEVSDVILVPNGAIVKVADVGPAALALGLDVEDMDLTTFMRAGRGWFGGGPGEGGFGGARVAGGEWSTEAPESGQGDAMARIQRLREDRESGEVGQESMRTRTRSALPQGGFQGGHSGGLTATHAPPRQTRPAVVFVMGLDSVPEPRLVQVGVNDWDFTQVVSGLEEGETLAVVGAAQLVAQMEAWVGRMRDRRGGSPFGRGGGGMPH